MSKTTWETYEQVTEEILREAGSILGIDLVESKQKVTGQATDWEVDVKAVDTSTGKTVLVECKRHGRRVNQATVASLAYQIQDTRANRGIIVTPIGLQEGAQRIAAMHNIQVVRLSADSDIENFVAYLADRVFVRKTISGPEVSVRIETFKPKTITQIVDGLSTEVSFQVRPIKKNERSEDD